MLLPGFDDAAAGEVLFGLGASGFGGEPEGGGFAAGGFGFEGGGGGGGVGEGGEGFGGALEFLKFPRVSEWDARQHLQAVASSKAVCGEAADAEFEFINDGAVLSACLGCASAGALGGDGGVGFVGVEGGGECCGGVLWGGLAGD